MLTLMCCIQIEARVKDKTPYVVVALQEAARMNTLLSEMRQSMDELLLGLGGSLNMSDKMEKLAIGDISFAALFTGFTHVITPSGSLETAFDSSMSLCRHCYKHRASFVDGASIHKISGSLDIDRLVPGNYLPAILHQMCASFIAVAEDCLLCRTS